MNTRGSLTRDDLRDVLGLEKYEELYEKGRQNFMKILDEVTKDPESAAKDLSMLRPLVKVQAQYIKRLQSQLEED